METNTFRFKRSLYRGCLAVFCVLFLFKPLYLTAATITSTASGGDWSTGSTWIGGNMPAVGDLVIIATTSGNAVTLTAPHTCVSLTINSGAILNLSSYTLTVNGPWVNNGTFNDGTGTVSFGTATAAINAGTGSANFENIIIASGATMNINTNVTVNSNFDFVLPAANNIVNINSTNSLNIGGNVTMILPTATRSSTMAVGAGTLTVNGLFIMQAQATAGRANVITISTGTANLNGGYSTGTTVPAIAAGCKITFTGAGTLNLSGTLSGGAPAITQSTGTINFKSATAQGIWLETYYNLGVFDGTKSLLGAVTVQNQLNLASGTLQAGAFNMTLSGSGDAFISTGTFDPGTALVTMSGAAATNIPAVMFNNLTLTGSVTRTVADGTTVTVNGNLAQAGDVVFAGTGGAYIKGVYSGFGTTTMGSGTLSLDSSYTASATFTPGTGTVKYMGDGGAVKVNWTYYNLEIDGNRSITGAVTVTNVLTVNSSKTLSMAGSPVNLTGNGNPIINNGTITSTTGALVFAGTGTQVIASGIYPKTTLSNGPKTIANGSTVEITGAFAVDVALVMEGNGSATITGATTGAGSITMNSGTLTFKSTFAAAAFTSGAGKVIYDGTAAQAVRVGIDYYDLELSSSVSNSIASGTLGIGNNLIIESTTTITTSTTLNISNDITGTGGFTAAGFVNVQGDWLHSGTLTPSTGTIHYNGTNQIVKNLSYYKLSMTGGIKSMEGNTTALNLVTINAATDLDMNGFTLEIQGPTGTAFTNLGTLSGNGKVLFSAAGAQTITSSTFYDLEFTGGAKTIATGANIETTNDWIVSATVTMSGTQNATIGRDLIHNASGFIDQGSGIIRIGRNWVHNGGTFDAAQGTVVYEGADQTIAPFTYSTLICDGTGTKSITGNILINGVLTINPDVTFDRASYTVTLPFNGTPFVNNGTLTGNGKFFYTGTGTQNIAPGSYYDLEFNTGAKNLPANQTLEILNDWIVSSATVFGANTTVSVTGNISGAGTFTLGNGTLNLAGSWNKTGTFTASNTGIFHYNGAAQNIAALDYYKLQISNPGTKSLTANTTVRDVLTINSGSTMGLATFTLTLPLAGTPFVNQGTILPGTSTVLYTNAAQTDIAPGNYYNLNGTNGNRVLPNGGEVGIAGTFTPGASSYSNVTGSTVNFNGTAVQNIPAFTFHKLILSGANDKSIPTATGVITYELEVEEDTVLNIVGTGQITITK